MNKRKMLTCLLAAGIIFPCLVSCKPKTKPVEFTYHSGPSDLPTAWNIHTYETNSATYVLDYTSDSLFTFDYNEDFTGYQIVPSMAADFPEDVTGDYVGKFGITEADAEEGHKVWAIPLKKNLKFDDGSKITADTFVESMQLLLNPEAANFRADNVYKSGDLKLVGAEKFVKQGKVTYDDCTGGEGAGYAADENVKFVAEGITANIETAAAFKAACAVPADLQKLLVFKGNTTESYVGTWAADNGYVGPYGANTGEVFENGFGAVGSADAFAALQDKSLEEILADDDLIDCLLFVCAVWQTDPGEEFGFFGKKNEWETGLNYDETVGFFADKKGRLCIVLINPMELNFYLKYELCTSFFLVNPTLYKSCMTTSQGVYTNTYGTSVETYSGFGPYKLQTFVPDSELYFVRNEYWHGYSRGEKVEGQYQTDAVQLKKVAQDATRLEMFLKGELDGYGLTAADMATYSSSKYINYTDSESTWFMAMNPDYNNLKGIQETATCTIAGKEDYAVIKTPIAIQKFRQALSYSIDRQAFNLLTSPTSGVAKACLSSMIIADPDSGLAYRDTEQAKDAILEFWGLADEVGPGKEYATKEEAIDSITGYDPEGAKALLQEAWTQATTGENPDIPAAKQADGKWVVQIVIGKASTGAYYTKGAEFFQATWEEAVKGTPWEGHLDVTTVQLNSSNFADTLKAGNCDVLFGCGFGGSMFNPYSMFSCFTDDLQYDVFTDKTKIELDVDVDIGDGNGVRTYRASLYEWCTECLQGDEIELDIIVNGEKVGTTRFNGGTNADPQARLTILGKAEAKIMSLSNMFPLQTDASASLRGARLNYKTQTYILGMGFGGLQYYTYEMNDTEWAAFVAGLPGGVFDYTASE